MTTAFSTAGERGAHQSNASRMLLILAHELRGPLAPIRNAACCLAMQIPAGTQSRQSVGIIERQVKAIESLIDSVLEAARSEHEWAPLNRARVDLGHTVSEAVDAVAPFVAEHGHVLDFLMPGSPIYVDADVDRVGQIVRNLLTNAAKYTDPGGRIDVRISVEDGAAKICVRDTGIGIAPDKLDLIFDLYAQAGQTGTSRSEGGLGIGLYVARQLALAHGGTLSATSAGANLGSEFTVSIPLAADSSFFETV